MIKSPVRQGDAPISQENWDFINSLGVGADYSNDQLIERFKSFNDTLRPGFWEVAKCYLRGEIDITLVFRGNGCDMRAVFKKLFGLGAEPGKRSGVVGDCKFNTGEVISQSPVFIFSGEPVQAVNKRVPSTIGLELIRHVGVSVPEESKGVLKTFTGKDKLTLANGELNVFWFYETALRRERLGKYIETGLLALDDCPQHSVNVSANGGDNFKENIVLPRFCIGLSGHTVWLLTDEICERTFKEVDLFIGPAEFA